ncbi:hypothetical protein MKZ38_002826 [Zalerion maritima]|uniref:Uncharacterized protein n=1 Tax=Zalerion maritima TaxID=339359 RepID=A0AAD5RPL7_9PEZI|nr:hypothetical protein MKZ38_002826 [Zalerion maritima]
MASQGDDRRRPAALDLAPSRSSSCGSDSSMSSLKPPRTPRFAEATAVDSPVDAKESPFSDNNTAAQPSDIGFGYISSNGPRESMAPKSPLKSAMKVPGTPGRRFDNPLSPTFREQQVLETAEKSTTKQQKRDLKIKTRVRMAKLALRSVNFSCSLIILAMLAASFSIFNATKHLASKNNLPPWASGTILWPQIVVLAASCVSLAICLVIFVGYCRGGHRRAEKVGVYYTLFAVGWFIFSMAMWAAAAGLFQFSKNNSDNKDMWAWACVDNQRAKLFEDDVDFKLVCRLNNWVLICIIIEIVLEVISITLYSVLFYRYYTKRKLHKSMDMRDRARSDLYLANLRMQSAPNTPGFGPKSPAFSQYALSPRFPPSAYRSLGDIEEQPISSETKFTEPKSAFAAASTSPVGDKPFKLQAPPIKAPSATPKIGTKELKTPDTPNAPPFPSSNMLEHAPVAPGEQQYESVPIPGAYGDAAVKSPPATQTSFR